MAGNTQPSVCLLVLVLRVLVDALEERVGCKQQPGCESGLGLHGGVPLPCCPCSAW